MDDFSKGCIFTCVCVVFAGLIGGLKKSYDAQLRVLAEEIDDLKSANAEEVEEG